MEYQWALHFVSVQAGLESSYKRLDFLCGPASAKGQSSVDKPKVDVDGYSQTR
jgi:hypothetical protein